MRKIASVLLLVTYLVLSVTGIQLVWPRDKSSKPPIVTTEEAGTVGKITERPKAPFYPKGMHEWAGYIFILAGVAHIYINRRPMKAYFIRKKVTRKDGGQLH